MITVPCPIDRLLVLVLLSLAPADGFARDAIVDRQPIDEAVIAEMKRQEIVGVAIGVIRDGRVVYTKGYGYTDLRSRASVTPDTVFNWASNSKPVMAVAAMQLVQANQLDLDQPIGTYIPQLPDHLKVITTRQLLCHQSGIPHYKNGKVIPSGRRTSAAEESDPVHCINRFAMSPLIFPPGSKSEYSSYAYVLLSAVVQAAGKQPIGEQLAERIVKPIGLTTFQLDLPYKRQRDWAVGYKVVRGRPQGVADTAHCWKHGAGGYKSSVKDFAAFAAALIDVELIDKETSRTMWTPQKTTDGGMTDRGLGLSVSGEAKSLKISHNGSQDEAETRLVAYPNQRHGVVVMCNTQGADPGKISTAIYSAINER